MKTLRCNLRKTANLIFLGLLLLSACATKPPATSSNNPPQNGTAATISPATAGTKSAYPAPASDYPAPTGKSTAAQGGSADDHYVLPSVPAFQALAAAEAAAKQWKKGAVLIEIPRLRQMETNLSVPKGPSGWFFMFMDPTDGSSVEYYIEVVKSEVVGKTEAQHVYNGSAPYKLQPIDMTKKLLDSPDVFKIYLKNGGEQYIKGKGRVEIDFQLVRLEKMENPVWSVFDTADANAQPLINVDAVTGQVVKDPFGFLRK